MATNTILAERLAYLHVGEFRVTRISHHQIQLWIHQLRARGKSVPATAKALSLVRAALT